MKNERDEALDALFKRDGIFELSYISRDTGMTGAHNFWRAFYRVKNNAPGSNFLFCDGDTPAEACNLATAQLIAERLMK